MSVTKIDHIGIAVKSIEEARAFYEKGLGLQMTHTEEVQEQGVHVGFLPLGESELELLEPLNPESTVARFLEKRGEGIQHICIQVEDIEAALAKLAAQGFKLLDKAPRVGAGGKRIAFVHPQSAHGVLIELSEKV